jgi:transcriptional regulator with XRE-family HTH domain
MQFSEIVKHVRSELHLSQTQLAEALSVSFSTVNRWENSRVVPSNLAQKSFYDFCDSNFIDIESMKNDPWRTE